MTLQMNYQEKYEQGMQQGMQQGMEQGMQQGQKQSALRMIKANKFSSEEIALYSGLDIEQVLELEKEKIVGVQK